MTIDDKINSIEYFMRTHFVAWQFAEAGLPEYFEHLRKTKPELKFIRNANDASDFCKDVLVHLFM